MNLLSFHFTPLYTYVNLKIPLVKYERGLFAGGERKELCAGDAEEGLLRFEDGKLPAGMGKLQRQDPLIRASPLSYSDKFSRYSQRWLALSNSAESCSERASA